MARWLGIGCGLILALALAFVVSGQASLDRSRAYTQAIESLPLVAGPVSASPELPERFRLSVRSLEFHTRVAGLENDGAPVLMLHGFPENSRMWEPLLEATSRAGYRAAAFDQRGYSPGARFEDVSKYQIQELEADVLAVADALGFDRFHLVGHDWGSIVGWRVVDAAPERVLSWTSLSIPHPAAVQRANDGGTPFYVRVFRVPGLMESIFAFNGFAQLNTMMAEIPEDQVRDYRAMLSEPGATTAALDWYRAVDFSEPVPMGSVSLPVLYQFGNRDMPVFVGEAPRAAQAELMTGPYESIEYDAGHWLIEEETEAVVGAILKHLKAHTPDH